MPSIWFYKDVQRSQRSTSVSSGGKSSLSLPGIGSNKVSQVSITLKNNISQQI